MEGTSIRDELASLMVQADLVRREAGRAELFKTECAELGKQVGDIHIVLSEISQIASSTPSLYERPARCILSEVKSRIERASMLVEKCRRIGFFSRVFNITAATDFRRLLTQIDESKGDMKWLLRIYSYENEINLVLPPRALTDPTLSWVWSHVSATQMGSLNVRVTAALGLSNLAQDSDRNKKLIIEEGGVPPLLRLLKEGSPEAQITAANTLEILASDREKTSQIAAEKVVPVIVQILPDSPMMVQASVLSLASRMAEYDTDVKEDFGKENIINTLISILSSEVDFDVPKVPPNKSCIIHPLVEVNKEMTTRLSSFQLPNSNFCLSEGSGNRSSLPYESCRCNDDLNLKFKLKINCAKALLMLSKSSESNSRRIIETNNGLVCLAKNIEKELGELHEICLMVIREICVSVESNAVIRLATFKKNTQSAKAVIDQLLRIIQEGNDPRLQILAIQSIGSLAKTFPERETRVIRSLVNHLRGSNDIAVQAVIALMKFTYPDNRLCKEHSKTIVELGGVPLVMRLFRSGDKARLHALVLLCYLLKNVRYTDTSEHGALSIVLRQASRSQVAQHQLLKELISDASKNLLIHQAAKVSPRACSQP